MFDNYDAGSLRTNGSISVRQGYVSPFVDNNTSIIQVNTDTEMVYEYNNGTHTISANNQTATGTNATPIGNFKGMTVTRFTAKELKIKPL